MNRRQLALVICAAIAIAWMAVWTVAYLIDLDKGA